MLLSIIARNVATTVVVAFAMVVSGWSDVTPAEIKHDFHVSYGSLAVEANVAMLRIRFFKDDLELALGPLSGEDRLVLTEAAVYDALFLRYLSKKLSIRSGEDELSGTVVSSGEDELDREPVWWYLVQFEAPETIESLEVRNTLLFEVFDDQKNLFKVAHFPEDVRRSYYFAKGEETATIDFW